MVGYIGSDRERIGCAMHQLRDVLVATKAAGYGVAHYTDDALLLNRRPGVEVGDHAYTELLGGIKSRVLLMHVFPPGTERVQARDLHPFKFRNWAFALTGGFPSDPHTRERMQGLLLRELPDFILRDVKGHSCAEALFHHFLACLHRANKLETTDRLGSEVAKALRDTLAHLREIATECGVQDAMRLNVVTTDGHAIYALSSGGRVAFSVREGIANCDLCYGPSGTHDTFSLRESHQRFRGVVIAVDFDEVPSGWKPIEEGAVFMVSESLELQNF
jgi:glutamine amidotransferase